jgi:hypothetical protein
MDFNSAKETIDSVVQHLRTIYRTYEGAQFRFAFFDDGTTKRFLTGYVVFCERHVPSRQQADYWQKDQRKFTFTEYWCHEQWEAVKLLLKLLSGVAEIGGHRIESSFNRSYFERQSHPTKPEFRTGWELRSIRDRNVNSQEIYVPQGRLTARGLKSYRGPDEAINDWIFGLPSFNPVGSDVPMKDTMLAFFPDTRARIVDANWNGNELHLKLEINTSPEQLELQIRNEGSSEDFQVIPVISGQSKYKVAIPSDAESLSILLLDDAGQPIFEQSLDEFNPTFGESQPRSAQRRQGTAILDSAELIAVNSPPPIAEDEGLFKIRGRGPEPRLSTIDTNSHDLASNIGMEQTGARTILPARIAIFISHSTLDKKIAENLTEILKNSLEIDPSRIRCTSVEGHRLQGGVTADVQLRQELLEAECFVGLLTPQSVNSTYVLFELGARWGADRRLIPLLAAGLQPSDLRGPLTAVHAHSCDSASELHQLIDELADILKTNKRPAANYEKYIERLAKISRKMKSRKSSIHPAKGKKKDTSSGVVNDSDQLRILEQLAGQLDEELGGYHALDRSRLAQLFDDFRLAFGGLVRDPKIQTVARDFQHTAYLLFDARQNQEDDQHALRSELNGALKRLLGTGGSEQAQSNREFNRSRENRTTITASEAAIDVKIVDSKFRASQDNPNEPVWVSIRFRLDVGNRGAQTTLNVQSIDIDELPLIESALYGHFDGGGKIDQRRVLESGYSGIVICSIKGKTTKAKSNIPSAISGKMVLRETLTGNLQPLAFTARKEE